MLHDFLIEEGFLDCPNVQIIEPQLLSEDLLRRIHSEDYIAKVKMISETGEGEIDIDTPGFGPVRRLFSRPLLPF